MLEPNQIFAGRYRIVRHLADGGMGIIFEAEHLATEAHVALKLLWPHVMQVASARQRFELEAKVAARVNCEHIVRVLDAGFDPRTRAAYLAMELLVGSTLAASVKSHGPMSPALTVALMRQVARGLDAAHGYRNPAGVLQPIVHRDLKPENLFLCVRPEGLPQVKILDFGIAKVVRDTADVSRDLRGTPAYMAYEQVAGEALSPQTDIWAFGLITYYALTGHVFWPAADHPTAGMQALFAEILTLPLPRASDRMREDGLSIALPRAFDAWLLGCIARKPAQRFASAGEAMDALELVLQGPPATGDAPARRAGGDSRRFTELAYATTAVLQGGVAPTTASHSVAGIASERSHLGGSPRRVVALSVLAFTFTLIGLAWHFAVPGGPRESLPSDGTGDAPGAPRVASELQPVAGEDAEQALPPGAPAPPPRGDGGDARDGMGGSGSEPALPRVEAAQPAVESAEPRQALPPPLDRPSGSGAEPPEGRTFAPAAAPRARAVAPPARSPVTPTTPRESPEKGPPPEAPVELPAPPVRPLPVPSEPPSRPEPPAAPPAVKPEPPAADPPAQREPPIAKPEPSPSEPAPAPPESPPSEPREPPEPPEPEPAPEPPEPPSPEPREPPEPPSPEPPEPSEPAPAPPPEREPPADAPPPPDERPSKPPPAPCTFDPYTGRCSPESPT